MGSGEGIIDSFPSECNKDMKKAVGEQCRHMPNSLPDRAENTFKVYRQEHAGHCGGTCGGMRLAPSRKDRGGPDEVQKRTQGPPQSAPLTSHFFLTEI